MQETADVVIVGAGVIGCSTAYHLAHAGVGDVVVLEKDQVGGGSSSKSAAMLSLQFCQSELSLQMAKYSYERYMAFEEELGFSIDFHRTGWMYVATQESAEALRHQAELLRRLGVTTEILAPAEVAQRYPELRVDDVVLGTWGPDDGPIDPHMIMWAYMKRAREQGVTLYEGVAVQDVVVEKGRLSAVTTDQGTIATRTVINAAGPWATRVGGLAGVHVPLENSARTIVVTDRLQEIPSDRPFVEDYGREWYCRPEMEGVLMGMGARRVANVDKVDLDQEQVGQIIDVAIHRIPAMEKAAIQTAWTGVRPLTADGQPIVGRAAEVDGFLLNCGWGGVGIIMAPIAGQLMVELLETGSLQTVDAAPLQPQRFNNDKE